MSTPAILRAFSSGELSPSLHMRADIRRYIAGLRRCRNFMPMREGGAKNRPGTLFLSEAGDSTERVHLIPFIFEAGDQTYVIEAGNGYFRFYWHHALVTAGSPAAWSGATAYEVGDLVTSGGSIYYCILAHTNQVPPNATYWYLQPGGIFEIPTPYVTLDVRDLNAVQSVDVLTITHPSHAPMELRRYGHTQWVLATVTTGPDLDPPTAGAGVAGVAGSRTYKYVVTALKAETFAESRQSAAITVASAGLATLDNPHVINWSDPGWAEAPGEFNIYSDGAMGNGIYGLIGQAAAGETSFNDPGLVPHFTESPPLGRTLFNSTDNYPGVAAYYHQRRWFARTNAQPETVWASRVGEYANFDTSTPLQDDDAIEFVIASLQLNPVYWLIPLKRLLLLSDAGEWVIRGDEDGAVTPTTINADQLGYSGAHPVTRPVQVGNGVIYVQARGTRVRDLRFESDPSVLGGRDLSVVAQHLFDGYDLRALAFQQTPHAIVWAARSDGTLLSLTYDRNDDILAWAWHDFENGAVEDVLVVPDTTAREDILYMVVRRVIDGGTVRYIERLASRMVDLSDPEHTAIFADSAVIYDGAPATIISGLDHLEGEVVSVLRDGVVEFDGDPTDASVANFTVTGGQITMGTAGSVVIIGLPITAEIETLPLDVDGSTVRDRRKLITGVTMHLDRSTPAILIGPDEDHLLPSRQEAWETTTVMELTGSLELPISAIWEEPGVVFIRNDQPLPCHIIGLVPHVTVGG